MDQKYADYIVLGYQGNLDHYVLNKRQGKYQAVNFFSPDEVFESYGSFYELLSDIVKHQLS
jgi:hypothetical protein